MPLQLNPLPSRDRPDLEPVDDTGGATVPPLHPEAMVRFLDGTWRLCKVLEGRRIPGGWACHLSWGVSGRVMDGWFRHNAENMS